MDYDLRLSSFLVDHVCKNLKKELLKLIQQSKDKAIKASKRRQNDDGGKAEEINSATGDGKLHMSSPNSQAFIEDADRQSMSCYLGGEKATAQKKRKILGAEDKAEMEELQVNLEEEDAVDQESQKSGTSGVGEDGFVACTARTKRWSPRQERPRGSLCAAMVCGCGCLEQTEKVIEQEAAEVKEAMETVAIKVEQATEEVAQGANQLAEKLAEGARDLAVEAAHVAEHVVEDVEAVAGNGLHVVQDFLEAKMIEVVRKVLQILPPVIKAVTDDPEAPQSAKETKDKVIDVVWPEVEKEVVRQMSADFFGLPDENEEGDAYCCLVAKIRYRLFPFNRGVAGVQQDPFWVICVIISVLPFMSIPAYFFAVLFLLIDKTDEFQLLFFILQIRGFQFVSDGVINVYFRYFQSFTCMMLGKTCDFDFTGSEVATVVDLTGYGLRILCVWLAWILLHCKAVQKRPPNLDAAANTAIKTFREGKLRYFLFADLILSFCGIAVMVVVAVLEILVFPSVAHGDHRSVQFVGTKTCVKVVHGVLCLPFFVLLVVPLLRNVVLHTFPTGYDKKGRCRNYIGPQIPPAETANFLADLVRLDEIEGLLEKVKNSMLGDKTDLGDTGGTKGEEESDDVDAGSGGKRARLTSKTAKEDAASP
eukprot:s1050_g3.t1